MLDDNLKEYIDLSFSLVTNDWHKTEEEGRYTQTTFPVKECTI